MADQTVFRRYEIKYLLTRHQAERLQAAMAGYMAPDRYGRVTVRSLYFDTDNYRLIRRSLEKPVYKEKLRLRSYCQAGAADPVFVELKKKYRSVVYKRRLALPQAQALAWLAGGDCPADTQIAREIDYAREFYGTLAPRVFLSYDRQAWRCEEDPQLRITFDENVLCRREALDLGEEVWGAAILPRDRVLMEVKTIGGMPLWLCRALEENRVYKTSFSKYGTAYQQLIFEGATQYVSRNF